MAILVEHDKRKHEILEKSLALFCKEGYDDVTFQKIADACGITRTTLYIYFKNKQELFVWSIKHLTSKIEQKLGEIIRDESLSADECLRQVVAWILSECSNYHRLFKVLLPYLLSIEKSGIDPGERVRRRVIRIKHILSGVIIRGQNEGVFKKVPISTLNDLLYSSIETAMFRISVLNQNDTSGLIESVNLAIDGILLESSKNIGRSAEI